MTAKLPRQSPCPHFSDRIGSRAAPINRAGTGSPAAIGSPRCRRRAPRSRAAGWPASRCTPRRRPTEIPDRKVGRLNRATPRHSRAASRQASRRRSCATPGSRSSASRGPSGTRRAPWRRRRLRFRASRRRPGPSPIAARSKPTPTPCWCGKPRTPHEYTCKLLTTPNATVNALMRAAAPAPGPTGPWRRSTAQNHERGRVQQSARPGDAGRQRQDPTRLLRIGPLELGDVLDDRFADASPAMPPIMPAVALTMPYSPNPSPPAGARAGRKPAGSRPARGRTPPRPRTPRRPGVCACRCRTSRQAGFAGRISTRDGTDGSGISTVLCPSAVKVEFTSGSGHGVKSFPAADGYSRYPWPSACQPASASKCHSSSSARRNASARIVCANAAPSSRRARIRGRRPAPPP